MRTMTKRTIRRRPGQRPGSTGFSLVEVMVALGILAFALPMVASALMMGMMENELSVKATMGAMVADNAVAMLRIRARNEDVASFPGGWGVGSTKLTLANRVPTSVIDEEDCVYSPFDEPRSFRYVILGQRMKAGVWGLVNDFRFVVLVYRQLNETDTLDSAQVTFNANNEVNDAAGSTYVRLTSNPTASALVSYQVVRMSLRPTPPSP